MVSLTVRAGVAQPIAHSTEAAPSAASSVQGRIFTKIRMTKWAWIPIILTLGLFFQAYQDDRVKRALRAGDFRTAENAVRWGGRPSMKALEIMEAIKNGSEPSLDAVRFLVAQTNVANWRSNSIAEEIISARDDHDHKKQIPFLVDLVPNSVVPLTSYYIVWRPGEGDNQLDVTYHQKRYVDPASPAKKKIPYGAWVTRCILPTLNQ